MKTTKEWRERQRESLRAEGWTSAAKTTPTDVAQADFTREAVALFALLDDADEADAVRAVLAEIAEIGCEYGDDCPTFGTRHGQCVPCKARRGCAEEVGAQLGEVVVPRLAGEWKADNGWSERHVANVGLVGRVRPGIDNEGAWVAWSWPAYGHGVRTEHPTRADAEAAVDERLRAEGVVLP